MTSSPPPSIGSNNPFRRSFIEPDPSSDALSEKPPPTIIMPPPPQQQTHNYPPPAPSAKLPSASPTIPEEAEPDSPTHPSNPYSSMNNHLTSPKPAYILSSSTSTVANDKPAPGNGNIYITIHPTDSNASSPPSTGHPTTQMGCTEAAAGQGVCGRRSGSGNMWPALRFAQKDKVRRGRRWVVVKVVVAVVIVVGAVAVGLGISKAVRDRKGPSE